MIVLKIRRSAFSGTPLPRFYAGADPMNFLGLLSCLWYIKHVYTLPNTESQ